MQKYYLNRFPPLVEASKQQANWLLSNCKHDFFELGVPQKSMLQLFFFLNMGIFTNFINFVKNLDNVSKDGKLHMKDLESAFRETVWRTRAKLFNSREFGAFVFSRQFSLTLLLRICWHTSDIKVQSGLGHGCQEPTTPRVSWTRSYGYNFCSFW